MSKSEKDPIAEALNSAKENRVGGNSSKIEMLFGDRPQVLDAIIVARRDRKLSCRYIANIISGMLDEDSVSQNAVKNWLNKQGIS